MKGEGLIVIGFGLFIGFYLFHSAVRFPPSLSVELPTSGVASRLFQRRRGPLKAAAVVIELDGIALMLVGLTELRSPGALVRWFGYDYAALAFAVVLGAVVGWAAIASWRAAHRLA